MPKRPQIKRADLLRIARELGSAPTVAGAEAVSLGDPGWPLGDAIRQHLSLGPEPVVVEVIADGD